MRNRSRLELYLHLTEAVSDHSDPITIAKEANLSLSDTQEHLCFLVSQGFLWTAKQRDGELKYELTTKGFEALEALRMLTFSQHPLLKHAVSSRTKT